MASISTVKTARHLHLVRAAQSAGEAFAWHAHEDAAAGTGRRFDPGVSLILVSLGIMMTAALYLAV